MVVGKDGAMIFVSSGLFATVAGMCARLRGQSVAGRRVANDLPGQVGESEVERHRGIRLGRISALPAEERDKYDENGFLKNR